MGVLYYSFFASVFGFILFAFFPPEHTGTGFRIFMVILLGGSSIIFGLMIKDERNKKKKLNSKNYPELISPNDDDEDIAEPNSNIVIIDDEKARIAQAEADERAYWNSPEGRRVRAERELAEIRRQERAEATELARRMAQEEHERQQEALKSIKDL